MTYVFSPISHQADLGILERNNVDGNGKKRAKISEK